MRTPSPTASRDLHSIFLVGSIGGLTDGQLMERFVTHRDVSGELAFAALVDRHGPMILRVCRAILRDDHEAMDAFQATFLVLVRKGGSLWIRDSIGPWLHRVARRAAGRAKARAERQRALERRASEVARNPTGNDDRNELARALHEEIDRLPERYRMTLVLCDLEGHTCEEAARQLGRPVGTIKSLRARGRERLRDRLTRRGLVPTTGVLAALHAAPDVSAAVHPHLVEATLHAAVRIIAGEACTPGVGSSAVAAPIAAMLRAMLTTRIKTAIIARLMLIGGMIGAGLLAQQAIARRPDSRSTEIANSQRPVGPGDTRQNALLPPPHATRTEKSTRVLYLHGPGSPWEQRYLFRSVASVKEIQLDSYIVRAAGEMKETEFLAGRYDVYVLGDLPADLLTRSFQGNLVKEVEAGAGVIFLGGRASFGGGGWGRSDLLPLMPTKVSTDPDWTEPEVGVRVVPEAGKLTDSSLKLGSDADQRTRIWKGLPPVPGINRLGPLKSSASLLARTDSGQAFLVSQTVGKGRVLAIAGETWPWARQSEERRMVHRQFWVRSIQWAAHRDLPRGN